MICRNPILPGFYPDPSICRVGEDYYLVNSTFAYFPGIPLFHSRNLAEWEQVGNVLTRNFQVNLVGCGHSEGIYAPTIRFHQGIYYVIATNVSGGGNFVVTAEHPEGPWSEPYYLGEAAPGIDPSLFYEEDGTCWYIGNRTKREAKYFGDCELWVQQLDLSSMCLVGESQAIWDGFQKHALWPEGPHLYKKDGYYYLIYAESGTELNHCVAAARSRKLLEVLWAAPWACTPPGAIKKAGAMPTFSVFPMKVRSDCWFRDSTLYWELEPGACFWCARRAHVLKGESP